MGNQYYRKWLNFSYLPEHYSFTHIDDQNDQKETALILASLGGHLGTVKLLLEHSTPSHTGYESKTGMTALHGAALGGHWRTVSLLLRHGAHPHVQNFFGKKPVDLAELKGKKFTAGLLRRAFHK